MMKHLIQYTCLLMALLIILSGNMAIADITATIQLTDSTWSDMAFYQFGDSAFIQVTDQDINTDPDAAESLVVHITSNTEDTGTPSSATIPVAGSSNVGNGTIDQVITSYTTLTEDWQVACTAGGTNARFSVNGSVSGLHKEARIGTEYTSNNGEVTFTISRGTTNFAIGDTFNFSTQAGDIISEAVTLTESGINTGIFRGSIALDGSGIAAVDGDLDVTMGDFITVIYNDQADDFGNPATMTDTAIFGFRELRGQRNNYGYHLDKDREPLRPYWRYCSGGWCDPDRKSVV